MKILFRFFVYGLIFLSLTGLAESSYSFSQDQQEVIKFIQKLYATPTEIYLFSEFNNEFQPKKHFTFMEGFIVKESLFKRSEGHCFVPLRYPTIDEGEYLPDYPTPQIQIPVVKGNLAEVLVLFKKPDTGRVRYYLKKTQIGWRIYKARSDDRADIPENNINAESETRMISITNFPPTTEEIEEERRRFSPK